VDEVAVDDFEVAEVEAVEPPPELEMDLDAHEPTVDATVSPPDAAEPVAEFELESDDPSGPDDAMGPGEVSPFEGLPRDDDGLQPPSPFVDEDSDVQVEFSTDDESGDDPPVAPPVKRVHVSNHMDILAELEGLRKQATMGASARSAASADREIDLDALIGGGSPDVRELRRRIEKAINSDVFRRMHGVQLAVRIQDRDGETIHTLDPVSLVVDKADALKKLSLQLTVDLENLK